MSIIYDYLLTKLKQPRNVSDNQLSTIIQSVANHVATLYFRAAKKKDAALVQLLDSTLKDSLDEFFSITYNYRGRNSIKTSVFNKVHQNLVGLKFKAKPVPYGEFSFLKEHLSWMRDIHHVTTHVARYASVVQPDYTNPELMTDHEIACVLLSGFMFDGDHGPYSAATFLKKLPTHLKANHTLLLLADRAMSSASIHLKDRFEKAMKASGEYIDPRTIDYVNHLHFSGINHLDDEKEKEVAQLLISDRVFIDGHDLHMDRVTQAKSISALHVILLDTTSGLKELGVNPTAFISRANAESSMRCANTSFEIYNAVATKLDAISGFILSNYTDAVTKVSPVKLLEALRRTFSTYSFVEDAFKSSVLNFDFKHLPKLAVKLFNELSGEQKCEAMCNIASSFPVCITTAIVSSGELKNNDMALLVCETVNVTANKRHGLTNGWLSKLIGAALSRDVSILDKQVYLNSEAMRQHGTLTRYEIDQAFTIKDVVKTFILADQDFYEQAIRYKEQLMVAKLKNAAAASNPDTDMSYMQRVTL